LQDERTQRQAQISQLEADKKIKEDELSQSQLSLQQLQEEHEFTKEQILQTQGLLEGLRNNLPMRTANWMQRKMNTTC
jgi:chromosome segregation protein